MTLLNQGNPYWLLFHRYFQIQGGSHDEIFKRLTALLLTFIMVLGIPILANAIQDWYGVSDPLQYTSDLHIGSYTYRAGTSSTVMRLDETNRIAYCIQPDVQIGGNEIRLVLTKLFRPPRPGTLSH